jgi:hypothetical protein
MGEPWSNRKTRGGCASQIRIAADTAASTEDEFRLAAETDRLAACAPQTNRLLLLVAEETPAADDFGNLRWDHGVPAFVAAGDAFEDVSRKDRQIFGIMVV